MLIVLLSLWLTVAVYAGAKRLYRWTNYLILSPLVVCPVVIITVLGTASVSYSSYYTGGHFLSYMLEPATVAMAVPIYKYRSLIRTYVTEIIISVTGAAMVAIVTSVAIAEQLGVNSQLAASLAPRSVTTPLAINVSRMLGGNPTLTAVFVIITGLTGAVLTSLVLKWVKRPITQGMMFGISAHGTGLSKAYEQGVLEGAVASIAMVFMGLATIAIAPLLVPGCLRFFG